jgi:hypothetical protein
MLDGRLNEEATCRGPDTVVVACQLCQAKEEVYVAWITRP